MTRNEIANMAISHLGVSKPIINIDQDKTPEAEQCRLFFDIAFKESLEACRYTVARSYGILEPSEEVPENNWRFAYKYPADCLFITRVLQSHYQFPGSFGTYYKQDGKWDIGYYINCGKQGRLIYCNYEDARIEYSKKLDLNPNFSSKFYLGLSYLLATYICPTVTKGRQEKYVPGLMQNYKSKMQQAQALNHNEDGYKEADKRSHLELSRRGY